MKLLALLTILILLSSCEGFIKLSGKIVSGTSGKEIEGVKIELLDIPPILHFDSTTNTYKDSVFVSDKNGLFTVHSRMVGMIFGPPKYRLRITKDGFQTSEIKITKHSSKEIYPSNDTIYIIKLKKN
jgi:hypothetical protein